MNRKVFIAALVTISIALMLQLCLKFIFPEIFLIAVEEPHIVQAGNFISQHSWLYLIVLCLIGILSDYLYFGAVCRTAKLKWTLWIIMLVYNITLASLYTFAINFIVQHQELITGISLCYLIGVASLYTTELRPLAITLLLTNINQLLVLYIRNVTILLTQCNILTTILVSADSYLWAALCFVIFRKGGKQHGNG